MSGRQEGANNMSVDGTFSSWQTAVKGLTRIKPILYVKQDLDGSSPSIGKSAENHFPVRRFLLSGTFWSVSSQSECSKNIDFTAFFLFSFFFRRFFFLLFNLSVVPLLLRFRTGLCTTLGCHSTLLGDTCSSCRRSLSSENPSSAACRQPLPR